MRNKVLYGVNSESMPARQLSCTPWLLGLLDAHQANEEDRFCAEHPGKLGGGFELDFASETWSHWFFGRFVHAQYYSHTPPSGTVK
jgi:hypothetical protein